MNVQVLCLIQTVKLLAADVAADVLPVSAGVTE
jgi:hypothetical protein